MDRSVDPVPGQVPVHTTQYNELSEIAQIEGKKSGVNFKHGIKQIQRIIYIKQNKPVRSEKSVFNYCHADFADYR